MIWWGFWWFLWDNKIRFKGLEICMLFVRIVQDLTANHSSVTSNLNVEILLWIYILQQLIEITSHINNCPKGLLWELQFRMSLLYLLACVELVMKKNIKRDQIEGSALCPTRCPLIILLLADCFVWLVWVLVRLLSSFGVVGFFLLCFSFLFVFVFLISEPLCSQRGTAKPLLLLARNLLY